LSLNNPHSGIATTPKIEFSAVIFPVAEAEKPSDWKYTEKYLNKAEHIQNSNSIINSFKVICLEPLPISTLI
jgi:hypothetical protein